MNEANGMRDANGMREASLTERILAYSKLGKMKIDVPPTSSEKWWYAFVIGILFFLLSSSFAYGITNGIIGMTYANSSPTMFGLFIHALVFVIIIRLVLL